MALSTLGLGSPTNSKALYQLYSDLPGLSYHNWGAIIGGELYSTVGVKTPIEPGGHPCQKISDTHGKSPTPTDPHSHAASLLKSLTMFSVRNVNVSKKDLDEKANFARKK